MCRYYKTWSHMLDRCYSAKFQATNPTYKGCSVAVEWFSFMAFREWMMRQDWQGNQLDKDLIIDGNKIYSPEACVFVDAKTNSLLTDRAASRGALPMGVSRHGRGYQALCRKNGKPIYLGTHDTPEEAHKAYSKFKAEVIHETALQQPDERVKDALLLRAKLMAISCESRDKEPSC